MSASARDEKSWAVASVIWMPEPEEPAAAEPLPADPAAPAPSDADASGTFVDEPLDEFADVSPDEEPSFDFWDFNSSI